MCGKREEKHSLGAVTALGLCDSFMRMSVNDTVARFGGYTVIVMLLLAFILMLNGEFHCKGRDVPWCVLRLRETPSLTTPFHWISTSYVEMRKTHSKECP